MRKIKCRIDVATVCIKDDYFSCQHEIFKCESLTAGAIVIQNLKATRKPSETIVQLTKL